MCFWTVTGETDPTGKEELGKGSTLGHVTAVQKTTELR